jgi:hypothetical protein
MKFTLFVPVGMLWSAERVESHPVCGIRGLKNQEDGDGVHGIFETSAEKAGKMRAGEDPSIAQAGVKGAGVLCATRDRVAAARPYLDFVAALLGAGLSE